MVAISPKATSRKPRAVFQKPIQKQPRLPGGCTPKLIRLSPAELKTISRAASRTSPPSSVSHYIVRAALDRAQLELA